MKPKYLIMLMLLALSCAAFAQEVSDVVMTIDMPLSPLSYVLQRSIVDLLALIFSGLLSLAVVYLNRFLKLNMTNAQVIEKIIGAKELDIADSEKKELVVKEIEKNKKLSKWVNILYGSIGAGVDIVYQTLVKRKK